MACISAKAGGQGSQPTSAPNAPIAIVPLDLTHPDRGPKVNGTVEVADGKALITSSAEITSGPDTTQIELPRRGVLRVCASTSVHLSSDTSVPAGETPGLMMALDHGALEADFATSRNADILLTPDFRILIGGPGSVLLKIRLGERGDTCVDNPGADAPYVLVSSVFNGGAYRVEPGQRVLFEHGSLQEVNDNEKEPCGCPPPTQDASQANAFPLAQSQGMAPLPKPAPNPPVAAGKPSATTPPLVYNAQEHAPPAPAAEPPAAPAPAPVTKSPAPQKKTGFFHRIGSFFKRIFGAES
jgi:cell division septation protein DedD